MMARVRPAATAAHRRIVVTEVSGASDPIAMSAVGVAAASGAAGANHGMRDGNRGMQDANGNRASPGNRATSQMARRRSSS